MITTMIWSFVYGICERNIIMKSTNRENPFSKKCYQIRWHDALKNEPKKDGAYLVTIDYVDSEERICYSVEKRWWKNGAWVLLREDLGHCGGVCSWAKLPKPYLYGENE